MTKPCFFPKWCEVQLNQITRIKLLQCWISNSSPVWLKVHHISPPPLLPLFRPIITNWYKLRVNTGTAGCIFSILGMGGGGGAGRGEALYHTCEGGVGERVRLGEGGVGKWSQLYNLKLDSKYTQMCGGFQTSYDHCNMYMATDVNYQIFLTYTGNLYILPSWIVLQISQWQFWGCEFHL